jgi:hypothetical protein
VKRLIYGGLSALILTTAVVPAIALKAEAQMRFNFSAPFIADSGIASANNDSHFINVAVTGYPLTSLTIALPGEMKSFRQVRITDQTGKEVTANVAISTGSVAINFPQPISPDNYIRVTLNGVEMSKAGQTVLYRVFAMKQGLMGDIPVGTAMVRVPDL